MTKILIWITLCIILMMNLILSLLKASLRYLLPKIIIVLYPVSDNKTPTYVEKSTTYFTSIKMAVILSQSEIAKMTQQTIYAHSYFLRLYIFRFSFCCVVSDIFLQVQLACNNQQA